MKLPTTPQAALALLLLVMAPTGMAQLALPPVATPGLPVPDVFPVVRDTLNGVGEAADVRQLRDLRRLRIRSLLQGNRNVLEADPHGALILRREVTAFSPTADALDRAQAAGFVVARTRTLAGLDAIIVVLQAPAGMSTRRALQQLRKADPAGVYDFNHVYTDSGVVRAANTHAADTPAIAVADYSSMRVGLIDAGVYRSHPVLQSVHIHEHGCTNGIVPSAHGTAVASLLVGRGEQFHGAAAAAALYTADVYCGVATGGAVDAISDAFAWLAREQVPVINISLVGPPNALLEQVVRIVIAKGHLVVAAVGNDGPSAPPLYPAAYPAVVAVTGVNGRNRVLVEACRGKHVDFAAPGSDMAAAGPQQAFIQVRGTSFAAPLVAGLLARQLLTVDKPLADAAVASLISQAQDLGARGVDAVYGNGLVGANLRMPVSLATTHP